jgi:general secretion pathway protein J
MKRTHPAADRGFTLLELLVAIAVFAIMAVMAYGGLSNVIANSDQSKVALNRLQQVQLAMLALSRDFSQISKRNIRDEYGNSTNYLMVGGDIDLVVEFTRNGRRNPAELLRSHLQRVAYKLEDDRLIRMHWNHLDRSQGAEPVESELLNDVNAFDIRFLDSNGEWHSEWPPLSPSSQSGEPAWLVALELNLELADWGELRRIYATGTL